jgi:3-oxoacyl-[acyl-carrier protein] reductase
MNIDLRGKRALVAGSTQGIGKAIAEAFSECGAEVVLVARNEVSLEQVKDSLSFGYNQNHDHLVADFEQPEELRQSVEDYIKEEGGFHILVNNTGGPAPGPITEASADQFHSAFTQHVICNQFLTQACIEFMKDQSYGRIINVVSTSVKIPIAGLGVSNTIRAAVANWSKTMSLELAPFGITVNNILPGFIKTSRLDSLVEKRSQLSGRNRETEEMEIISSIPAGRLGHPKEIGVYASFLASPYADYITGTNMQIDGGRTGTL